MKKIIVACIALLLVFTQFVGVASAQGEELIANGSFEAPVVNTTAAVWEVYPSGSPDIGWQADWFSTETEYAGYTRPVVPFIELHHPAPRWLPYEGNQYAELDTDWFGPTNLTVGEPASIRLYQDIPTCAGGAYELKYAWSPRPNHADNLLQVSWGDALLATHTAAGAPQTTWTSETWSLTATGSTTRLSFAETGVPNGLGMFLDGVSLIQTNECGVNPGIDIKPGKYPNTFYLRTVKNISVAILGSADFNIYQIDIPTLTFAGLHLRTVNGIRKCSAIDISGPAGSPDGLTDLLCVYVFDLAAFSPNPDGTATLTGSLVDGTPFWGSDVIDIRP